MSDRKLDMWVAENIFKETYCEVEGYEPHRLGTRGIEYLPFYSSHMNDAVKVLQHIDGDMTHDSVEWNVGTIDTEEYQASHKDPAMAICLAAYKIKTEEDWTNE